jgi:hypothetical protein
MKKNYFYDLPDDLQAEIYKKVFINVINELTSIINLKNISHQKLCNRRTSIYGLPILDAYRYLCKDNNNLYKLSVLDAIRYEKVFKILYNYNHLKYHKTKGWWRGRSININYTYNEGIDYKKDNKDITGDNYDLNKMICGYGFPQEKFAIITKDEVSGVQVPIKEFLFNFLQENNQRVFKSWNKKKLMKACMSF